MKNILEKYIEFKKYHSDQDYIGCIFYGSSLYNTFDENSDIDVIFVFENINFIEKKGYIFFENREIEYFERSISSLFKRIDTEIKQRNDSFYSIIGKGLILEDKNGKIQELKATALKKYETEWDKNWNEEEIKYKIRALYKSLNDLNELSNTNYFHIYYGIVLEKIRQTYHEINNLSRIGSSKVIKYYNKNNSQFKLPNKKFISLYKKCVNAKTKNEKQMSISKLYNYINKYNFDMNNIEIELRGQEF